MHRNTAKEVKHNPVISDHDERQALRKRLSMEYPHTDPELVSIALAVALRERVPWEASEMLLNRVRLKLRHD